MAEPSRRELWDLFRNQISRCEIQRRQLSTNWQINIDYRRGKPLQVSSDMSDSVAVNVDWPMTRSKITALFSQVPRIYLSQKDSTAPVASWIPRFEQRINEWMVEGKVEAALYEALADCINAAGIGIVLVAYEALAELRQVPVSEQPSAVPGLPVPVTEAPYVTDYRFVVQRISPVNFLWPLDFVGSDFDQAPWIGRTGRMPWVEAMRRFGLRPEDRRTLTAVRGDTRDYLSFDQERAVKQTEDLVGFDEIFYKAHLYEPDAQSFSAIRHLVFLHGRPDEPVVDEPWKGQTIDPQTGEVLGAQAFPIRVLTLNYLSDEAIPPSDSALGRYQVQELNKGRTILSQHRERSLPTWWYDANRVDASIQVALMRGIVNRFIPVVGDGSRVFGNITGSTMIPESLAFDRLVKQDLQDIWGLVPPAGVGIETSREAAVLQSEVMNNRTRERARVASFITGIAKVLAGLISLYDRAVLDLPGFSAQQAKTVTYTILPDATILLDASQRLSRLAQFLHTYAPSGWVQIEPVLREITALAGLDPNVVVRKPEPKAPEQPNISLRFTGSEDLTNPLVLALLLRSGQAPTNELLDQARALIQHAVRPSQSPALPGVSPGLSPAGPMLPEQPGEVLPDELAAMAGAVPGAVPPVPPVPPAVPPGVPPAGSPAMPQAASPEPAAEVPPGLPPEASGGV